MNSSQLDVQTLAARIEKLEAANRRWKSASAIALLFLLSMLLSTRHAERVAAARPDRVEPNVLHARTVEAEDFVLKDADGHVCARFSISPNEMAIEQGGRLFPPRSMQSGQASIQFYDEKGRVVWSAPAKPQFMTVR